MKKRLTFLFGTAMALALSLGLAACGEEDFGTLSLQNVEGLKVGEQVALDAKFSIADYASDVTYSFEGNDIQIADGKVTALSADKTVTVSAKTTNHETTFTVSTAKGELKIDDVYAWYANGVTDKYPASDFYVTYSASGYSEEITYTYDTNALTIDAANKTVRAKQSVAAKAYEVTASSANFSGTFNVNVEKIYMTDPCYAQNSGFTNKASAIVNDWVENGNSGKTTAFFGDSFFDSSFWDKFHQTSTAGLMGKDALCMGIGGSTGYDWEQYATTWVKNMNPRNIVMHLGTNNIYDDGNDTATATSSLQRFFTVLHHELPNTKIYWFSISPRTGSSAQDKTVKEVNANMKAWCEQRDYITYIHTYDKFTLSMLYDGIHPADEHYQVFVDALKETDIVIDDLASQTAIADRTNAVTDTINGGTGLFKVKYRGAYLSDNYILTGKLDITEIGSNAHVQFGIDTGDNRVLLWRKGDELHLYLGTSATGANATIPTEDKYVLPGSGPLTLDWTIAKIDDDFYFFIGQELKLVFSGWTGTLQLGSEATACKFYQMSALTQAGDTEAFNAVRTQFSAVITQYGSASSGGVRV